MQIDGHCLAALSRADQALGRLDGTARTLPTPDLFVAMYVRQEAFLSSPIEGTQASLSDVLAFEAEKTGLARETAGDGNIRSSTHPARRD